MANPYSQYTGTRISAVPTGYLTAAASSAEGVRKSGERMGDMIGKGIAKYYEGKQEDEDKEKLAEFAANLAYQTDDESNVPSVEEPSELGEDVERTGGDRDKEVLGIPDWSSVTPEDEAAVLKSVEAHEAAVEAQKNWKPDPDELAALAKSKEPPSLQDKYDHLNEGLQQFLSNREDMSPETFREGLKMYQSEKKQVTDQHRWEAEEKRLGAAKSATASALTEKIVNLDAIAADMGWDVGTPEGRKSLAQAKAEVMGALKSGAGTPADLLRFDKMQSLLWYKKLDDDQRARFDQEFFGVAEGVATPTAKLQEWQAMKNEAWFKDADDDEKARQGKQFFGVDKDAEPTPAEIQRFNAMKTAGFYVNADEDERARIEAAFFKVETPEATLARRQKEAVDKKNRDGFIGILKAQGKVDKAVIAQFEKLGSFDAMDAAFDNLTDDQKGKMPADARTWAAIRDGFPATVTTEEKEKYRRIHFGLEDRESLTPNQKEMAAFGLIYNDPTKTPEEKIRAGYMYGLYSGPETARRYYEEWESKTPGATDEDKDEKRALLGLPTGVEAKHAQVKLELDEERLKEEKLAVTALENGDAVEEKDAGYGYKFVRIAGQKHWTLINTNDGSAAEAPVSDAQAVEWNKWLEEAGISYRWHPDNSGAGWSYGSMGGFSVNREFLGDKTGSTVLPRTPMPNATVSSDGKNAKIGVNTFANGDQFKDPRDGKWKIVIIEDGKVLIQQSKKQGGK